MQGVSICQKPILHALHHQVAMLIFGIGGLGPLIANTVGQVNPWSKFIWFQPVTYFGDRRFAVNEQQCCFTNAHCGAKVIIGLSSPATRDNSWHFTRQAGPLKKSLESLATFASQDRTMIPAAFDKQLYQRVPPISPRVHSAPNLYFSSHGLS